MFRHLSHHSSQLLCHRVSTRGLDFDLLEPRLLLCAATAADTQPDTQPDQPDTQATTQPATQPTTEPETQPTTEPTTQPGTEPGTEPTSQPIVDNTRSDNSSGSDNNAGNDIGDIGSTDDNSDQGIPAPFAPQYVTAATPAAYVKPLTVTLTWVNTDASADQIDVQRFDQRNGWIDLNLIPGWQQSYSDLSVAPGTTYLYALYAENAGGASDAAFSNYVTTAAPPFAPQGLAAQMDAAGHVRLNWSDPLNDNTGFILQRGDTGGDWTNIATLPAATFSYTDAVAPGQVAAYRIFSMNGSVVSNPSNVTGAARLSVVLNLYHDVLGRSGDDAGISYWSWAYASNGLSAAQIAAKFLSSPEYHDIFVTQLYHDILHRAPDAAGFNNWVAYLEHSSLESARTQFYASDEYARLHGSTASSLVSAWYQALLGRAADAAGLAYWMRQLAAGGRTAALQKISASPEAAQQTVTQLYQRDLHRAPDPGGLANWSTLLVRGLPLSTLNIDLLSSAEYLARSA